MESLSRPPHRRKQHSSATNSRSYDDVLLSNGNGKTMTLRAQEYAEIFAGSSSIPVLDLSSLDNQVGSGSGRVDYSNIFGGLRNDDVALPYEELIHASSKPAQQQQRSQADARSPSKESGSLHPSGRTKKPSAEASDQSPNGVKQQINLSFNKTSQTNKDELNGKTHIAQFHAVPAFTRFVDEASKPQKKVEDNKHVSSLKREVSRTWSFSAEVEAINRSKGVGLNGDKFHTPEKLHISNGFDLKSQPSKVPSSDRPSKTNDKMDSRQSKLPSFVSEEDACGKISGNNSPEFLDEELDENSDAAVSAAALKKAIDQAQESIRIAKMIMEGREGLRDTSKPRSKKGSRVKDKKKIWIDHEVVNHSNDRTGNHILTGADGKPAPSFSRSDPLVDTRKADVERITENVETAKEHVEASTEVDKKIFPSLGKDERLSFSGKIEQEKRGGNIESVDSGEEAPSGPGLVANTESRDVNLMSRLVENINSMLFRNKLASPSEKIETGKVNKDDLELLPDNEKGFCELAESTQGNSELNCEPERSVNETADQFQGAHDHSEEPEKVIELLASDFDTVPAMQDMVKIVEEECEISRTSQEDQVVEENESTDDKESDNRFQQTEEVVNCEDSTVLRSEIHNLMDASRIEEDLIEQEEMSHKTQSVNESKEHDQGHGDSFGTEENVTRQIETHQNLESGAQLNEDTEEQIKHSNPEIILEIEEIDIKDGRDHEPEIDKKMNHPHDVDEEKFPGELEQVEERDTDTTDSHGSTEMESDNPAAVQNSDVFQDAEETKVKDIQYHFEFQEVIYDKDVDKSVDASSSDMSSISNEDHHDDRQQSYDLDLDDEAEKCQNASRGFGEKVAQSSGVNEVNEAEQQSCVGDIKMPETCGLCPNESEENVDGITCQNTNEGATSDGMNDYFVDVRAENEEKLPKDQDGFETADEIGDAVEESAAEIQKHTSLQSHPDDNETAEFDITYVGQEFERTSGSDGESVSTCSFDNIDGISGRESVESEDPDYVDSNKDEIKDDSEITSTERKSADEQNNTVCSASDNEPKDIRKAEGDLATGQYIEKSKEDPRGTSTTGHKYTKEKIPDFDKDDHRQRVEAIKKGRERQKHKIAVERAIREVRERAFAEAQERAAQEKVAAEARQRAAAEAKASIEAKKKAERAAVERVTAEALERAREKAKTSTEARKMVERSSTEKFASSSRYSELKHSVSSSDLEAVEGKSTESAQRQKAKLEKHNRIMERAAKALEEKNMRDLIAQKEQAERNRLSQTLDAEVKRWAMGKEGNLRALLSTLQYILGTNSGWQPISLTEIITTAAVKKAYRKATLYVHPDKLQQRGASIQQKYICEKVFDLLKAAWNRFNSEER